MATTPLYLRWLWWRHTWTFQGAHKPLCSRYHRDVLRMGQLRVCRSCTALYGCFALTLSLAPFFFGHLGVGIGMVIAALACLVLFFSQPTRYRRASRWQRDLLRGSVGTLGGLCVALLFTSAWFIGLTMLVTLGGAWWTYRRKREAEHSPDVTCAGCPEYGCGVICSGYEEQAVHLRAYEEAATDWLERNVDYS